MIKKLKAILSRIKALFSSNKDLSLPSSRSKPNVAIGDKVGNVTIEKQYQLDKHTDFKVGESYRVGEMIVTLHANKESMLKAIAAVDKRRIDKEERLRERGIEIMLMNPEELLKLQVEEWLKERHEKQSKIAAIIGGLFGDRYIPPVEEPPKGSKEERFQELMKEVKEEEKVH